MATIYNVSGMKCHGCEVKIEDALKKEGFTGVKADKESKTVKVDDTLKENPKIVSIIRNLGFSIE